MELSVNIEKINNLTVKASDKAIIYEEKIVKVEEKLYGEMELNLQGVVSENIYGVAEIIEEEGI